MSSRTKAMLLVAGLWILGSAVPAMAQGPARAGWWNTATVSGTALPSTTGADNLRVSGGPSGTLAYAALSYRGSTYASARLTLHVVSGSEIGTPAVLACPTRGDAWPAGGDQPIQTAPAFDCAGRSVTAVIGADSQGTTLTFLLDPTEQQAPGITSLALVPGETSTPFSLDLAKPDSNSLTVVAAASSTTPSPWRTSSAPADPPSPGSNGPSGPLPGQALPPLLPTSGLPPPPLSAPPTAPAVAPPGPIATPVALNALPVTNTHVRRMAAILLALLAGALGYLMVEHRVSPPHLIGGRARAAPSEALAGPRRGIGRFAHPRSSPPRGLR